jgi:hypothetical protein
VIARFERHGQRIEAGLARFVIKSNFGWAARQSTSVLIRSGFALAPSFLRAISSIPSFGNSEIRRERLFARYQQKCQQTGRLR